jgi:hypothetical protein
LPFVTPSETSKDLGVLLRVGVFALIALLGYFFFPMIMLFLLGDGVPLIIATLGTFAAAAVANAVVLRIYERAQLADIGLGWTAASRRNLLLGSAGGIGAGAVVLVGPLLVRAADLTPIPNQHLQ